MIYMLCDGLITRTRHVVPLLPCQCRQWPHCTTFTCTSDLSPYLFLFLSSFCFDWFFLTESDLTISDLEIHVSDATTRSLLHISRLCCCKKGALKAVNKASQFRANITKNFSLFSLVSFSLAHILQRVKLFFILNFLLAYIGFLGNRSSSE